MGIDLDVDIETQRLGGGRKTSTPVPPGPVLPNVPNLLYFLVNDHDATLVHQKIGNGDSLAASGGNVTLTDAAPSAAFVSANIYNRIEVVGAGNANNNGFWTTNSVPSGTTIRWGNAIGASEASFPGAWNLYGRFSEWLDQTAAARLFNIPTPSTSLVNPVCYPDVSPGKNVPACMPSPNSNGGYLEYVDSTTAMLFSNKSFSFATRLRLTVSFTGTFHQVSNAAQSHRVRHHFTSDTGMRITLTDGVGSTNVSATIPAVAFNVFSTWGATYDQAIGQGFFYKDGVLQGQSAAGLTPRTPTMTKIMVGPDGAPGAGSTVYYPAFAGGNAVWSAADHLAVHNAFLAWGAP